MSRAGPVPAAETSCAWSWCSSASRSQHGQGNEMLPNNLPPSACTKSICTVGEEQKRGVGVPLCCSEAQSWAARGAGPVQAPHCPRVGLGWIFPSLPLLGWAEHCPSPSGHQYGVAGPVASCCPCPKPLTFQILLCLVARPAFIPRVLGVKVRSVS